MLLIILALGLFVMLIILHEYGHFLVAKLSGVEVEEFGIGFPPRLFGRQMGRGLFRGFYSINLLPLGGFVKLKGEHDSDNQPGSFGAAALSAKMRIMLAGVLVNLVVAILLLMVVVWLGMPKLINNQFTVASDTKILRSEVITTEILGGSPAARAGLRDGDVMVSIDGRTVSGQQQLRQLTKSLAGRPVTIVYERSGQSHSARTKLLTTSVVAASLNSSNPKGYLGIGISQYQLDRSTWSAPIVAAGLSTQLTGLTFKALGVAVYNLAKSLVSAISGHGKQAKQEASAASANVSGPVGIYAIIRQGSTLGYQFILFVVALISLTLAIVNFLPIPALDGGRAFIIFVFRLFKKRLLPKTEELINGTGFALLMLLLVVITVVDIRRFY